MYDTKDLPASIPVCADAESDRVLTFLATDGLPEEVKELLAGEGIWGAHRREDDTVVVVTRDGQYIETDSRVNETGYVLA